MKQTEWSRVGTGMIIYNNVGQILMGKRISQYAGGKWCNAGGKLEFEEDPKECAIREALEETNIKVVDVQELGYMNDMEIYDGVTERHWVTLMFAGRAWNSADLMNVEPTKHEEWRWFHLNELPKDMWDPMWEFWCENIHMDSFYEMLRECYKAKRLSRLEE